MDIAVTGSSGLIGGRLVPHLEAGGHRVLAVVRRSPTGSDEIGWEPAEGRIDRQGLEGLDAVVHLAGAGIADRRWTEARKQVILESRTGPTRLLAEALAGLDRPPSVLVSASAIGAYGDRGDEPLTEDDPTGEGFLADVCRAWEAAAAPAGDAGIRVVHPRTGIVLDAEGGALAKQLPLFRLGLGGRLGDGSQWMSWISHHDEIGALAWLLDHDLSGPVNLTAPEPVTNAAFTEALGDALGRPTVLPVPSFGPKLLLGADLAEELLFASAKVVPAALDASGYPWAHRTVGEALEAVLGD